MQKAILFIALLLATTPGISQDSIVKPKKFDHYIGLQANELLRQLVSLSDNNTEINNPYLLTYTLLASKHQVGIQLGFGFDVNESKDLTSRQGIQRKCHLFQSRCGEIFSPGETVGSICWS
jgi:hypothetical protein